MMSSKSVGCVNAISDVITSKFKWEINNFSSCCDSDSVDCFESPKFTTDDSAHSSDQWHLRVDTGRKQYNILTYLADNPSDFERYWTLYVYANGNMLPKGDFKIFNNADKEVKNQSCEIIGTRFIGMHVKTEYAFVILTNYIKNPENGILNGDKLTIACEIRYDKATNREIEEQEYNALLQLKEVYAALLNDSRFSDISLISEGKAIKVHKCILASRSSVFAAMFDAEMKEKQENSVEIADIKYDVLKEMIRFIYTGRANDIDTLAGELAVAADKYALDELKNTCEKTVIRNLSLSNIIDCVELADKLSMDQLKKKAIEFIVENASDIIDKPEFDLLSRDILREVFRFLSEKNK